DGSPRREEEIEPFSEMLVHNDISLLKVIIFKLNREDAFKRLTGRRICPNCGKIYNIYYNPPPEENACEGCDGELEQREDDKPEVVNKRINEFEQHTVPVIQYFKEKYLAKTMEIDALKPIDQILEIIWSQISEYLNVHKV
ncbi:adenylate kinase, partial [candidate division KSB1 bacterium]|nr:adenylate kinase [candidate division KSB1 bacterium]